MWPGSRSVRMSALGSALSWDGRVACGSRWRRHAGVELKQHIKPPPGFERQHAVSNLVDIVFPHHIAALRAEGNGQLGSLVDIRRIPKGFNQRTAIPHLAIEHSRSR